MTRFFTVLAIALLLSFSGHFQNSLRAAEEIPQPPKFYLNGKPVILTVQDLSGFGTRPLRLLVQRNNRAHGHELIQVYALGAREGEDLRIEMATPVPGMRVTVYKILHEPDGARYLSMPASVYFDKPGETFYEEKTGFFREAFFIIAFEKTDSPNEKDINVRYFEERVRKLSIASYKTNFLFSSLKLKMKDFADPEARDFFERDAQLLVGRLINPRRVFLIRLWKIREAA
ncbi:MAG: hypothetical protein PHV97_01390 [Candidatus Omnitrophica bacterium]|nr:hypothetical protein [Candidatus Omnitrophota bacterium]